MIHDIRRTAARDMWRRGISGSDIMALAGWEPTSMFRRYAILGEQALEAAAGKRFGHVTTTPQQQSPAASLPS